MLESNDNIRAHQPRELRKPANHDDASLLTRSTFASTNQNEQTKLTSREDEDLRDGLATQSSTLFLEQTHTKQRQIIHRYVFKRPPLPQSYQQDTLSGIHGSQIRSSIELGPVRSATRYRVSGDTNVVEEGLEALEAEREWLNLFIDLIWAGIVSNIGEVFNGTAYDPAPGSWSLSFLQYLILFLTAWRFWNDLREFLDDFFNKDLLQSLFIIWILVLGIFFGNNALYFSEPGKSNIIVWTYLTAKASFIAIRSFYCIFVPELRHELRVTAILMILPVGLWIGSIWLVWPLKAGLIVPAILFEGSYRNIMLMPLPMVQRLARMNHRRESNPEGFAERLQAFFVIILGEGVARLIQGSPLGYGITLRSASGILPFIVYYALAWMLFTGDQTRSFIPAIHRDGQITAVFKFLQVMLFGSLLLLDASLGFLIRFPSATTQAETDPATTSFGLRQVRWTISGALTSVLVCMTGLALLNKSLDKPGTLLVDNRYLRMGMRAVVIMVVLCLPTQRVMGHGIYVGIIVTLLQVTTWWEYLAGLERGSKLMDRR